MFDIQITLKDGRVVTQEDIGLVHLHWIDGTMEPSMIPKIINASMEATEKKKEKVADKEEKAKMALAMLSSILGGMSDESK